MSRRILGLVAANRNGSPLRQLGAPDPLSLTPFGGPHRFIDFALANLLNSGISELRVCESTELRPHRSSPQRASAPALGARRHRPTAITARSCSMRAALAAVIRVSARAEPDMVVVLSADHVLLLDLRPMLVAHERHGADITLATTLLPACDAAGRVVVEVDRDDGVAAMERLDADPAIERNGLVLVCTGDIIVRASALSTLLRAIETLEEVGHADDYDPLLARLRVAAYDVDATSVPGPGQAQYRPYWHEPSGVEAYYHAQMELCTVNPGLDLYNPAWPIPLGRRGLGPAKIMADAAGRKGVAFDALVSDGAVIRGGVVVKSVIGPGAVVDSGAEVEDCVLLDGCHIGRGARLRRAVVGVGVAVGEGEEIGYDAEPPAPSRVLRSGLILVPPTAAFVAAAAG